MYQFVFRLFYALSLGHPPKQPVEKEYMWVCPRCNGGSLFHVTSNTYSVLETMKQLHEAGTHGGA